VSREGWGGALGRLDGVSTLLPDRGLFLYAYVRKEAVLSSQIEGTRSSLSDLLLFELDETPGVSLDDVAEVSSRPRGHVREPLLYLSLYLNQHRARYYELLDTVRRDGDWEAWLAFFLEGVRESADGAVSTAQSLDILFGEDRERVVPVGRRAGATASSPTTATSPP